MRSILTLARSPRFHLLVAAAVTGLASYVYLAIVARALDLHDYAQFSFFWSFTVVISLGVFLPVEQELARRESHALDSGPRNARRVSLVVAALAGAIATAAVVAAGSMLAGASLSLLAVGLGATAAVATFQFTLRGMLAGTGRLTRYAIVAGLDGVLRIVLPIVVILLLPATPLAFALVLAVATLVSLTGAVGVAPGPAPRTTVVSLLSRVGRLIAGAIFVQALVNFAPIIAYLSARPDDRTQAGVLLAAVTLGRIPIFVYQSLQAGIIPAIAGASRRGDPRAARRLFAGLASTALALGAAWTLVLSLVGPALLQLMFGAAFQMSGWSIAAVSGAMAAMLVGMVASDAAMAVGGHSTIAIVWAAAAAAAISLALVIPDLLARSTMPVLIVGLAVAVVLSFTFMRRTRAPSTAP